VPRLRGNGRDSATIGFGRALATSASLQGEHVWDQARSVLLDQRGVFAGQEAVVQRIADFDRPPLMKMVEQAGIDARPVVDGHGGTSSGDFTTAGAWVHRCASGTGPIDP